MDKWSIIVYLSIISVIIWFFLKSFGVFKSPTYIEVYPFLALAIGGGAAYGKIITTLKHIEKRTDQIPNIDSRLTKLETTCKLTHKRKVK